jgi:hypothetical protein
MMRIFFLIIVCDHSSNVRGHNLNNKARSHCLSVVHSISVDGFFFFCFALMYFFFFFRPALAIDFRRKA